MDFEETLSYSEKIEVYVNNAKKNIIKNTKKSIENTTYPIIKSIMQSIAMRKRCTSKIDMKKT